MNIRFLETFYWVAKLGSFPAAASKMHLTQAAISGRMASLEKDLGQKVFERQGRQMRLNSAGQTLLHHAEQILRIEHELRLELKGPKTLRGRVRLGVMETVIYTWFPRFLHQLQLQHPDVELELTVESSRRLNELLKRGLIDVTLQTDPIIEKGLRNTPLGKLKMSWVIARGPQQTAPVDLEAMLRDWTIVTFPRYSQPHLLLLELLEAQGITHPPRIHFVSSIAAAAQLLQTRQCVGALPGAVFRAEIEQKQYYTADHLPALDDMQVVASWRPEPVSGLIAAMVKLSLSEMESYAAQYKDAVIFSGPLFYDL